MILLRSGLFMKKTEYRKTVGLPLIADLLGLGRSGLKKAVAREDPPLAEQIAESKSARAIAAEEGLVPMLITQADEDTEPAAPEAVAAEQVRASALERALEIEGKGTTGRWTSRPFAILLPPPRRKCHAMTHRNVKNRLAATTVLPSTLSQPNSQMLSSRTRLLRPASYSSSPSTSSSSVLATGRNVLIHVFDEYRKSTKDFVCDRALLLAKMKYFQAYLNQSNEHDEIDISVHCDVEIFEWLVQYMQQSEAEWKPRIALDNIASILVSSEFLQMEVLVEECIRFITSHMQQFLQLRVDFSCLSEATIAKIAERCTAEELQVLHDPKDKILSKLQRKKLEAYVKRLQDTGQTVERCEPCEAVYLKENAATLCCPKVKHQVDVHGELVAQHQPKADWKVDEFLRDLAGEKHVAWSAVYWYMWASTNCFDCSTCKRQFAFIEFHGCAFHHGQVVGFGPDAKFSCCDARVFDSDDLTVSGCSRKEHVPIFDEQNAVAEKNLEAVTKIPMLWDLIRNCERAVHSASTAAAAGSASGAAAASTPSLQISTLQLLLHGEQPTHYQQPPSVTKRPVTAAATAGATGTSDPNSPRRRRQWRALQLQEKDRMRHQLLTRRLVQMRKNLTT